MKTDQLIAMLASGAEAVEPCAWRRRYAAVATGGLAVATVLLLLGPRDDLVEAVRLPMFWVKQVFPLLLAIATFAGVARLSRPGVALGAVPRWLTVPVVIIWVLALFELLQAAPGTSSDLLFGDSWAYCLFYVTLFSLPALAGFFAVMRTLAPTRLALAGGVAGLLAGTIGASAYSIHCPELQAPFIGIWYLVGMLIPAFFGFIAGPRVLRW